MLAKENYFLIQEKAPNLQKALETLRNIIKLSLKSNKFFRNQYNKKKRSEVAEITLNALCFLTKFLKIAKLILLFHSKCF